MYMYAYIYIYREREREIINHHSRFLIKFQYALLPATHERHISWGKRFDVSAVAYGGLRASTFEILPAVTAGGQTPGGAPPLSRRPREV